jgi:hypothetical protein
MSRRRIAGRAVRPARRGALVAAAQLGCAIEFPATPDTDRAVYSESLSFEAVEQRLPTLATHRAALHLAIRPGDVGTGALESVLLAARREGVPVRAWLLLDDEDGRWPGEHTLAAFDEHARTFWRWSRSAHLDVEWIVVDMQPELSIAQTLWPALEHAELDTAEPILRASLDPAAFADSVANWSSAVEQWHGLGMQVAVVAPPYVLDDFGDDDADLQDMLDAPVVGPAWDELAFRVQQNLYGSPDARLGAPLAYDYAQTIAARWGERGVITLGPIGDHGSYTGASGYQQRDALEADLDAAAAAGLAKFQVLSLDGMEQLGGPGEWLADLEIEAVAPEHDDRVDAARSMIALLDER